MSTTVVQMQIDESIQQEASAVLRTMGLTISDAFQMMAEQIAREKTLPFQPHVPNATTIRAMDEIDQGLGKSFDSVEALMEDLNS